LAHFNLLRLRSVQAAQSARYFLIVEKYPLAERGVLSEVEREPKPVEFPSLRLRSGSGSKVNAPTVTNAETKNIAAILAEYNHHRVNHERVRFRWYD
jgi:hypothetical protein